MVEKGFALMLHTGCTLICHSLIDLLQTVSIDVVYTFEHYYYHYFSKGNGQAEQAF